MENRFDWQSRLARTAYATFPEAEKKPVIGISANYGDNTSKLAEGYYKSVLKAGGVPVILPPLADVDAIVNTLERIDGLLLSGGADFNPLYAGEEPSPKLGGINNERDLPELMLARLAYNRQIPMLGICRGIQTLAMALDGRVAQDLSLLDRPQGLTAVRHTQDADRCEPTHSVTIAQDSLLYDIYAPTPFLASPGARLLVNSFHHQAVSDAGPRFRVTAQAADGVIEAIESTEFKSIIGVQWHPECLVDDAGQPLFCWLVAEAAHYRKACRLHERIVTLDSHCDTPMFFSQGVDFGSRDQRILVDLHKMTDGRQDATIMVAYVPQPQHDETFRQKVAYDVSGPKAYADLMFDKVETLVARNERWLALARTPDDLLANKAAGRKSIMLGIENGLALEGRLDNLLHFAQRGIVYMTLCHNGDNDICDSARGEATHNGVSDFGCEVISEMNRLGIMVDMSHAADKSFYDALQLSKSPIVCSHSNCRALCDHPRNLTDEQMRALADRGGVMQVTLYHGFLVSNGEATVLDALRHLDHAVSVMGIEHVGLGTDFDGDGGVRGMADASEMLNFTRKLMACRYSEADIARIWGGNFLRVMREVQRGRNE